MTTAAEILAATKTVLVVDWPSRDVPDTLARAGFAVFVRGGPGPQDYREYQCRQGEIVLRPLGAPPERVDLVYAHRPLDEVPGIVALAQALGAHTIWLQSGLSGAGTKDPHGCWMDQEDSREARNAIEAAGLTSVQEPYIADVVRTGYANG